MATSADLTSRDTSDAASLLDLVSRQDRERIDVTVEHRNNADEGG